MSTSPSARKVSSISTNFRISFSISSKSGSILAEAWTCWLIWSCSTHLGLDDHPDSGPGLRGRWRGKRATRHASDRADILNIGRPLNSRPRQQQACYPNLPTTRSCANLRVYCTAVTLLCVCAAFSWTHPLRLRLIETLPTACLFEY